MPKDNEIDTGLDVKMVYPLQGASAQGPVPAGATQVPNANGYVVMPGGQSPILVLQSQQPAQQAAQQPSVVVLTVAAKEAKKEEKKQEVSSVFQRL